MTSTSAAVGHAACTHSDVQMSDSDEEERVRYRELLEELRTILPGAQVLFAFLLTVPFAARFSGVGRVGKVVFTASLMAVTGATVLFTAPAAYHRLADRKDRRGRLRFGVTTVLAGLLLLAFSVTCAVFVVVRFLFDSTAFGAALAIATGISAAIAWYALPVQARRRSGGAPESQSGPDYPE